MPTESVAANDDRSPHKFYVVAFILLFALSFILGFDPASQQRPHIRGIPMPQLCVTQSIFGIDCPGCGISRSFILLSHGDFQDSLRYHRLGILVYLFFLSQAAYHGYAVLFPQRRWHPFIMRYQRLAPIVIIALIVVNWLIGINGTGNGGL